MSKVAGVIVADGRNERAPVGSWHGLLPNRLFHFSGQFGVIVRMIERSLIPKRLQSYFRAN